MLLLLLLLLIYSNQQLTRTSHFDSIHRGRFYDNTSRDSRTFDGKKKKHAHKSLLRVKYYYCSCSIL
jgi:hypothetical protein